MATDLIFTFHKDQREQFRNGALVDIWASRYPQLFDDRDIELAQNQPNYHFFEWLSAVMLFEATGYLSLLENYTAKSHPKKLEKYQTIVQTEIFEYTINNQSGLPDLFSYSPDEQHWLFCEVKGGPDKVRDNQDERMAELEKRTGKTIWIINLKEIKV